MERIAEGRSSRPPGRTAAIAVGLLLACLPAPALAGPVAPLVVDESYRILDPQPWVSPSGEQLVTYLREEVTGTRLPGVTGRIDGGPFGRFTALSTRSAVSTPAVGFGPDGAAVIAWQRVWQGAEQSVRPAGGSPTVARPVGECDGPVALAVSAGGKALSACRIVPEPPLLRSGAAGLGRMPSTLKPAFPLVPPAGTLTAQPLTAWGTDGTGVVAFGYRKSDPPAESGIAAGIVEPGGSLGETEPVASITGSESIMPTGVAVLPDGTVAITAGSDEGAVLFTRPPGADGSFEQIDLDGDVASMPSADRWGRLHFLTSEGDAPDERTWAVRILELDGTVGRVIPVPTTGTTPEPVGNGFQVFPNGTEAIVTRSSRGFFIAFRKPGGGAFSVPRGLSGDTDTGPGSVAKTPQGDLVLAWEREVSETSDQLMIGGWDSGTRPTISRLSMPKRVRQGVEAGFSVTASDRMGISRVVWKFPGGRKVEGASVRTRLKRPGENRVEVSVYDRAGYRSLRTGQVTVLAPNRLRPQGRGGTSGSPRP